MTRQQKASKRHAVLQRRRRVARLTARGRTQLEIADARGQLQTRRQGGRSCTAISN
jgi:hypothetical protein